MAKPYNNSDSLPSAAAAERAKTRTLVSKELPVKYVEAAQDFLKDTGINSSLSHHNYHLNYSPHLISRDLLKINQVQRDRISFVFSVLPAVTNIYNGLFGGAIGAISERVAIDCIKTVVGEEDKGLFIGELSMSYLSAPKQNEMVLLVEGSVVRSGRNLSVVAIEFRIMNSLKLACTARVTFYHLPFAKLRQISPVL